MALPISWVTHRSAIFHQTRDRRQGGLQLPLPVVVLQQEPPLLLAAYRQPILRSLTQQL